MLQPTSVSAQLDLLHGLFGKGDDANSIKPEEEGDLDNIMIPNLEGFMGANDYEGGLFRMGPNSNEHVLSNQGFGEIPTGISNESFQEDSPLGNGLLIMLVSGVGYAVLKRKTNKQNK